MKIKRAEGYTLNRRSFIFIVDVVAVEGYKIYQLGAMALGMSAIRRF